MAMPTVKKFTVLVMGCLFIFLYSPLLIASHQSSEIRIESGSCQFDSSYALHVPSAPSDLIVKLDASRGMNVVSCIDGPICPTALEMHLEFAIDGTQRVVKISPRDNGHYKITGMHHISSSSIWAPAIKELVKRVSTEYYTVEDRKREKRQRARHHPKASRSTSFPSFQIKPLSNCKLKTIFAARIMSLKTRFSPYPRRVLVDVSLERKNKELMAVATFRTKQRASTDDLLSVIEFVQTKNSLKEISRKNIERSSVWYTAVKKVVEKSVRQYLRFMSMHKKMRCKKVTAKNICAFTEQGSFVAGKEEQ